MAAIDNNTMEGEVQHLISNDSMGRPLEGHKKYKLHLPANIPASDFWSIIVYDHLKCLIIHTDQTWPSLHSNNKNLIYNNDGSVDTWFGPKPVKGEGYNCLQTLPDRQWYMILRLYYPLESWFDKSWQPGEMEEII
jgi:hypothetical protein